jgi:cancer susceptibility candidate protein 1
VDKEMSPGYILHLLSQSGIHLLPKDEDHKLAGIQLKSAGAENNAINEIMASIKSFSFRSCRQNISATKNSILVKLRENLEYDREYFEDYERDWTYIRFWENKCAFTKSNDEYFDPEFPKDCVTHVCLSVLGRTP